MIEININDITKLDTLPDKIIDILNSKKFFSFLEKKCKKEIEIITNNSLSNVTEKNINEYAENNKTRVGDDYLDLYNNSMVDLSNLSEKTKANYPNGLSLAKLVEYGTGIIGQGSEANRYAKDDNWEYDINKHGAKGWYYEKDGKIYWTKGMEGKLIYHKLEQVVENKIENWIEEFLTENINEIRM